jgi:hypothetical protein
MLRACVLTAALCLTAGTARAQIVNVQGALAKPPEADGFVGQVEAKLDWREGNNPLFDIGGAGNVLVRQGPVLALALARGGYGTSRGLTLTKKSFEHVRVRIELDCRWRWEAFAQHEYDQFRRLSLRALLGTGPAFQLLDTAPVGVLAGMSYLYETEQLDRRAGTLDAGESASAHRGSFYLTGHENLGEGVAIVETVYVQPRINRPSDLRVLGELAIVTKVSARLALKNSFVLAYDATPPDEIKRLDTQLQVSLTLVFGAGEPAAKERRPAGDPPRPSPPPSPAPPGPPPSPAPPGPPPSPVPSGPPPSPVPSGPPPSPAPSGPPPSPAPSGPPPSPVPSGPPPSLAPPSMPNPDDPGAPADPAAPPVT